MVRMEKWWAWKPSDPENYTRGFASFRLFGLRLSEQRTCPARNLGPQHCIKLSTEGHAYNPSTQGEEAGGSEVHGQPWVQSQFEASLSQIPETLRDGGELCSFSAHICPAALPQRVEEPGPQTEGGAWIPLSFR